MIIFESIKINIFDKKKKMPIFDKKEIVGSLAELLLENAKQLKELKYHSFANTARLGELEEKIDNIQEKIMGTYYIYPITSRLKALEEKIYNIQKEITGMSYIQKIEEIEVERNKKRDLELN